MSYQRRLLEQAGGEHRALEARRVALKTCAAPAPAVEPLQQEPEWTEGPKRGYRWPLARLGRSAAALEGHDPGDEDRSER